MKATDRSHTGMARLRTDVRDAVKAIGIRMPRGFAVHVTVGDRISTGFPAHNTQEQGHGRVEHGEWPFRKDGGTTDQCLRVAVANVLLRAALEARDRAVDETWSGKTPAWYECGSPLHAYLMMTRGKCAHSGTWQIDGHASHGQGGLRSHTGISHPLVAGHAISAATHLNLDRISLADYLPDTAVQAAMQGTLGDLIGLPPTGRPDVDRAVAAQRITDIARTSADGPWDWHTVLTLEQGPMMSIAEVPEGVDPVWLTMMDEGKARLETWLEGRRTEDGT